MSDRIRCRCQSCTIDSLMGPAIITTIGVLFLLGQLVHGENLGFFHTWPVILVVIGLIKLASAVAPRTGHISDRDRQSPPPAAPQPPPPSAPFTGQGQ
jgi:hypothetical protein